VIVSLLLLAGLLLGRGLAFAYHELLADDPLITATEASWHYADAQQANTRNNRKLVSGSRCATAATQCAPVTSPALWICRTV